MHRKPNHILYMLSGNFTPASKWLWMLALLANGFVSICGNIPNNQSISDNDTICVGGSIIFSPISSLTLQWINAQGYDSTHTVVAPITFNVTGAHTITDGLADTMTIHVVGKPNAPTLGVLPTHICASTILTLTTTPGSGGIGATMDFIQYQLPGGSWTNYTSNFNVGGTTGNINFQAFRTGGLGCQSNVNSGVVTIVAQPIAPTITPSYAKICGNTSISINLNAGGGGGGSAQSKYSISGTGLSITDVVFNGSSNPTISFPTVASTTNFVVSAFRTTQVQGCTPTVHAISQTVTVYPQLLAGGISTPQTPTSMCGGADSLGVVFQGGTGGFSPLDSFYYTGWVTAAPSGFVGPYTDSVWVPSVLTNNSFTIHSFRKDTTHGCNTHATSKAITVFPQPTQGTILFTDTSLNTANEVCMGLTIAGTFSGFASSGAQANYRLLGPNSQLLSFIDSNFTFNTIGYLDSTITLVGSSTGALFGCNNTGNSTASFLVVSQPAINSLVFDTTNVGTYSAVCEGLVIEGNFTDISGGGINAKDTFIVSTPATFNSSTYRFSIPTVGLAGSTINLELRRSSTSPGCTTNSLISSIMVKALPTSLPIVQLSPSDTSIHRVCQGFGWVIGTSGTVSQGVGTTTNQLYYQVGNNINPLTGPITFHDSVTSVTFLSAVVSDGPGCMASTPQSRHVTIAADPIITLMDDTTCKNTSVTLAANATDGIGPFNYQWQVYENNGWVGTDTTTTANGNVPVFFTQTTLTDRQTRIILMDQAASLGCDVTMDTATLTLLEQPAVPEFAGLDTLCLGSQGVSYELVGAPPSGIAYTWGTVPAINGNYLTNPNATFDFPAAAGPVNVWLQVENTDGCTNTYDKTVIVTATAAPDPATISLSQPGNTLICLDNSSDTYLWGFDDRLNANRPDTLEGEIAQQYFAATDFDTTNRAYWVITSKDGCFTKSYFNRYFTGISNAHFEPSVIKYWPNPTDGLLHISSSNGPIQSIACFDVAGRRIAQFDQANGNTASIDISSFPDGAYYLMITVQGQAKPYRIMKTNVR